MFCSTVIPTIGRPVLARAVYSVLNQAFIAEDFEVIVVNDSGCSLPEADWQKSEKVRVINTQRRERCVARNVGAAIATGKYLHFLDDDDWLLPGAFESFWTLAHSSNAIWLYGAVQLVDRDEQPVIQLRPNFNGNCFTQVMAGEWIPLQASLINAQAFFDIGGFHPLIPGIEDIDLGRRLALYGDVAGASNVVAGVGMGEKGSTTHQTRAQEHGRWAREAILDKPGVFTRMRASAGNSYWAGRIVRAYLTSMVWNLQRRRLFTAISRAMYGGLGVMLAGWQIFSGEFWRAVIKSYISQTFLTGFLRANPFSSEQN
jgi:glycosyltransferase involved in cell wall biosynthesis